MSEVLLSTLQRRFPALAEKLPAAMGAIGSEDPIAFLVRYRREALAGIPEPQFRKLRAAAREERDLERRRSSARRALDKAGKLTEPLAAQLAETRDTTWIEDLLRPLRSDATAKDPMIEVARRVVAGEFAAPPTPTESSVPAETVAPATTEAPASAATDASPETVAPVETAPPAEPVAETQAETPAAPAETSADAPAPADAAPAADDVAAAAPTEPAEPAAPSAPSAANAALDALLQPFCGPAGAHPTAADQRERLVGLVASLLGEDAGLRAAVRTEVRKHGAIATEVAPEHRAAEPWKPFAAARHPIAEMKGRDLFLLRRGQKLGAVRVKTDLPDESRAALLAGPLAPPEGHPYTDILREAAKEALDRHLLGAAGASVLTDRRRQATRGMLPRIAKILDERLMAPPAGAVPVVAVAPGTQGSCRLLVIDAHGRPGPNVAVHPLPPQNEKEAAVQAFVDMVRESGAKIVAVPGGRKARGLRMFAEEALAAHRDLGAAPVMVNESASAAWSETEEARTDAPELPASARVALSMGRFVQDPLAEASRWDLTELPLDPNQRDLDQGELRSLTEEVLEECVAAVGVDVNRAPVSMLARVPGLGTTAAKAIVAARAANGTFPSRAKVREVAGISEEQWQRAGGFLRVRDGVDPIDATGVHPTGLDIVAAIAAAKGVEPGALVGSKEALEGLDTAQLAGAVHTAGDVESVLHELAAGKSDPRTAFVAPAFNPGVERLQDLQAGMEVDGVVANVQKFGAFVDVGLRQHGLVHVSEISYEFVEDPAQVLTAGQKIRVKVLGIDPAKRRISLSMKALLPVPERPPVDRSSQDRFGGGGAAVAVAGSAARGPPVLAWATDDPGTRARAGSAGGPVPAGRARPVRARRAASAVGREAVSAVGGAAPEAVRVADPAAARVAEALVGAGAAARARTSVPRTWSSVPAAHGSRSRARHPGARAAAAAADAAATATGGRTRWRTFRATATRAAGRSPNRWPTSRAGRVR